MAISRQASYWRGLGELGLEAVEKEIPTDKAAQAAQATFIAPKENALEPTKADNGEAGV